MFSLLYGFYEYMFQKPNYKILIIGVDNSGKTVSLFFSKLKRKHLFFIFFIKSDTYWHFHRLFSSK